MLCCFGAASNLVRCQVVITAQLSPEGTESSTRPSARTSNASLSALPVAEHGSDLGNPEEFKPPSHFPGLATLVSGHVRACSRARSAEIKRVSCAPAAGAAMLVCITLVCDLTFAEKSRLADEWRVALRNPPAVLRTESAILADLVAKRLPGLAAVSAVVVSDVGTRREDSSSVHRLAGRPSQRRLRTSLTPDDISLEMAAAPPGTFNVAEAPPPEEA